MPAYRYIPRTKPFKWQARCLDVSRDMAAYAILAEQGTGKSKVIVDTSAYLYETKRIDAVVIVAPNEGDVPYNWIEQFEDHLPKRIHHTAVRVRGIMRAADRKLVSHLLAPGQMGMRVITTNTEGMRVGSPVFAVLLEFMRKFSTLFVCDESNAIESPGAAQTKGAMKLSANAAFKRITNGTPMGNGGPLDLYSQFAFLDVKILGFDSFSAYKAHYCQILPPNSSLVMHASGKMAQHIRDAARRKAYAERMATIIQIPARDALGHVIYRNTDELQKRMAPYSMRVLKKDELDLPKKLYEKRYVELTPKQREIYDQVRDEVVAEFVHDRKLHYITPEIQMIRLLRLQQIVCNHYAPDPDPDKPRSPPVQIEKMTFDKNGNPVIVNPRMRALIGIADQSGKKGIVWCRHRPELNEVSKTLRALYTDAAVVELHGLVKDGDRRGARHAFQSKTSDVRFMVAIVGIKGIDLYEAWWEAFYSNSYSLIQRKQSEDRVHRYGLKHSVTIFDIMARDTLDFKIVASLRKNQEISEMILGDPPEKWL